MNIITLETAKQVPFDLEGRIMFSGEEVELIHLTLKKDELLDLHKNPFDVIFYILSGSGLLTIDNKQMTMKADSTIKVDKEYMRSWENFNEENLVILVIKLLTTTE